MDLIEFAGGVRRTPVCGSDLDLVVHERLVWLWSTCRLNKTLKYQPVQPAKNAPFRVDVWRCAALVVGCGRSVVRDYAVTTLVCLFVCIHPWHFKVGLRIKVRNRGWVGVASRGCSAHYIYIMEAQKKILTRICFSAKHISKKIPSEAAQLFRDTVNMCPCWQNPTSFIRICLNTYLRRSLNAPDNDVVIFIVLNDMPAQSRSVPLASSSYSNDCLQLQGNSIGRFMNGFKGWFQKLTIWTMWVKLLSSSLFCLYTRCDSGYQGHWRRHVWPRGDWWQFCWPSAHRNGSVI